ncbi:MAG: K(+)-transporting ATPase subunit F [Actinobacteria bacterium]|nr:K(+)-transporting ATPase subunit F [Actinomycetota bacterium]
MRAHRRPRRTDGGRPVSHAGPGARPRRGRPPVSADDVVGLVLAVGILAYLVVALVFPERF